jgi:hypothetical protein
MGDEPKLALIESDVPKAIINKMKTKLKLRRTHCWRLRCAFADICDEFKPWQKYKKILYSTFFLPSMSPIMVGAACWAGLCILLIVWLLCSAGTAVTVGAMITRQVPA